jgi:hypothetical protein
MKRISGFLDKNKNCESTHSRSQFIVEKNRVSEFFENTYSDDPSLDSSSVVKIGHSLHKDGICGQLNYS